MLNKIENLYIQNSAVVLSPAEEAQQLYKEAMEIINSSPLNKHEKELVTEYINKAIELDPTYPGFYLALALTEMDKENVARARENIHKALELDPSFADKDFPIGTAYILRGCTYLLVNPQNLKQEDVELALADFEKADEMGFPEANIFIQITEMLLGMPNLEDIDSDSMTETTSTPTHLLLNTVLRR